MIIYKSRTAFVINSIHKSSQAGKILDVGFIGEYAQPFIHDSIINNFRQSHVVGIDISEKINNFKDSPLRTYKSDSIYDIGCNEFYQKTFDIVVMCEVIEHLDNPWLAFKNSAGALKKGGRLIMTFPNLYSFRKLLTYLCAKRVEDDIFINKFLGAPDHLHFPLLPGMIRYAESLDLKPIEITFMKGFLSKLPILNKLAVYVGIVFEKKDSACLD